MDNDSTGLWNVYITISICEYTYSQRYALIIELLAAYGLVNLFTSNNDSKLFTSKTSLA